MSKYGLRGRGVWLAAVGVAAMILAAPAQASPIRYNNPAGAGHFVWYGGGTTGIGLNVTLDAASQTGAFGDPIPSFLQYTSSTSERVKGREAGYDLQVAGNPVRFLVGVNLLDPIPTGFAWTSIAYAHNTTYPDQTQLPVGVEKYLGVRFPDSGGLTHYGYIGVVMDSSYNLDAFAWGYETTPGTPIPAGAPEPASLMLLVIGAVAALRRR
jgi:hypothetical protein